LERYSSGQRDEQVTKPDALAMVAEAEAKQEQKRGREDQRADRERWKSGME